MNDQGARVRVDHYIGHLDHHFHETDNAGFRIGHVHDLGDEPHDHPKIESNYPTWLGPKVEK